MYSNVTKNFMPLFVVINIYTYDAKYAEAVIQMDKIRAGKLLWKNLGFSFF